MTTEEKKIKWLYTAAALAGLLAFLFFLYPSFSNAWNNYVSSQLITEYKNVVKQKTDNGKIEAEIQKAKEYNEKLFKHGENNISEYTQNFKRGLKDEEYESILAEEGMMGYVEIPRINEKLPLKHYTTDEVLRNSVGHLYGSSFPVGGKNTHAVVSAHNALVSARLFTDLDTLEIKDKFIIHVGNKKLNYEVDQIKVVLPNELEYLGIIKGEDHVTLLTCTPYGVNTHRLLVRGKRIADDIEVKEEYKKPPIREVVDAPIFMLVVIIVGFLLFVLVIFFIWKKPKKTKNS